MAGDLHFYMRHSYRRRGAPAAEGAAVDVGLTPMSRRGTSVLQGGTAGEAATVVAAGAAGGVGGGGGHGRSRLGDVARESSSFRQWRGQPDAGSSSSSSMSSSEEDEGEGRQQQQQTEGADFGEVPVGKCAGALAWARGCGNLGVHRC